MLKVLSLVVYTSDSLFFMSKLSFDMLFRPTVFSEQSASGVAGAMANQPALVTNRRKDFIDGVFANSRVLSADSREQPSTAPSETLEFF
ncbi:hypothetical protein D3C76_1530430 [compost metagenome]